jgi:hypothetical protein
LGIQPIFALSPQAKGRIERLFGTLQDRLGAELRQAGIRHVDVQSAAERLRGQAHRTPVVTSRTFDQIAGCQTFFKCENLQRAGRVQFRGAYNALSQLTPEQRQHGVVAFSSGNHAQGLALAAKVLGIPATVVMPSDAPSPTSPLGTFQIDDTGDLANDVDEQNLRKRVLFMLGLLAVYRIGAFIPLPGSTSRRWMPCSSPRRARSSVSWTVSSWNLRRFSIFALGIMPYISSSIILQLLTVVVPYLERLSKEGEIGRRKITQYTRYGTVVLSLVQSLFISVGLEQIQSPTGASVVVNPGWVSACCAWLL